MGIGFPPVRIQKSNCIRAAIAFILDFDLARVKCRTGESVQYTPEAQ
jgi:hypothetical protein